MSLASPIVLLPYICFYKQQMLKFGVILSKIIWLVILFNGSQQAIIKRKQIPYKRSVSQENALKKAKIRHFFPGKL